MNVVSTEELVWFKSSYSGPSGDSCVEVAMSPGGVRVRDSKDIGRPHLTVSGPAWRRFVGFAAGR